MFRIDRRLVKLASTKPSTKPGKQSADESTDEVGVEGELPDAAASAEAIADELINEYVSAATSEAEEEMEKILDEAREQAAHIIFLAREDAEEEHKRAWQEGYQEGSEEGRRSYDEQTAEKISQDDEMLKRVLDELYAERERMNADMEEGVTNLALEIVKKIINPAEEALGDVFTSLIKNALRQMTTDSKVIIRVGPAEYERFFSSGAAEIELDSGAVVKADVLRDISLNEGDCIIDTDDVTINAGVDSQLHFVKLAFERANQYEPD